MTNPTNTIQRMSAGAEVGRAEAVEVERSSADSETTNETIDVRRVTSISEEEKRED